MPPRRRHLARYFDKAGLPAAQRHYRDTAECRSTRCRFIDYAEPARSSVWLSPIGDAGLPGQQLATSGIRRYRLAAATMLPRVSKDVSERWRPLFSFTIMT